MMAETETIAAVATGAAQAGIGIIRVSGPDAVTVCDQIFRNHKGERKLPYYAANTIHFGYICEPGSPADSALFDDRDRIIDEVLVSVFKAPHSYTAEDTVEINTHGGLFIEKRILELTLEAGARLAEPGEFTKRAFLNGRIDLAKAEAVMDLISSQNEFARRNAIGQLGGELSGRIRSIRGGILHEMARIEAALDDPEHYDLDGYDETMIRLSDGWIRETEELLAGEKEGRIRKEGIRTAIVGRPNAGKSSILNYLTDSGRAIVTDVPGTTRDILEETVRFGDTQLLLIDTAGIRDSDDPVEKIGISRSMEAITGADLIFAVIDGTSPLTEEDRKLAENMAGALNVSRETNDIPAVIILINKSDREQAVAADEAVRMYRECFAEAGITADPETADIYAVVCSAVTGEGISDIKAAVSSLFGQGKIAQGQIFVTNSRHTALLKETAGYLKLVREAAAEGVSEDLYVIDMMNAYTALGRILGEALEDDLVDEIFSAFCMGK